MTIAVMLSSQCLIHPDEDVVYAPNRIINATSVGVRETAENVHPVGKETGARTPGDVTPGAGRGRK